MRNVSINICSKNQNTYFVFNNISPPEIVLFFEKMWETTLEPDMLQMTIWRMRMACWIPKATNAQPQNL